MKLRTGETLTDSVSEYRYVDVFNRFDAEELGKVAFFVEHSDLYVLIQLLDLAVALLGSRFLLVC